MYQMIKAIRGELSFESVQKANKWIIIQIIKTNANESGSYNGKENIDYFTRIITVKNLSIYKVKSWIKFTFLQIILRFQFAYFVSSCGEFLINSLKIHKKGKLKRFFTILNIIDKSAGNGYIDS